MGHASLTVLPLKHLCISCAPRALTRRERNWRTGHCLSLEMNPRGGTLAARYRGRRAGRALSPCSYYYLYWESLHTCPATDSAAAVSFDCHLQVCGRQGWNAEKLVFLNLLCGRHLNHAWLGLWYVSFIHFLLSSQVPYNLCRLCDLCLSDYEDFPPWCLWETVFIT